jgi:deoxyribonuclease-4
MKRIGAHVSAQGGVQNAPANATAIGAKAFALFIKNPRGWGDAPLSTAAIDGFRLAVGDEGFSARHIVPHTGYLINLGSPKPDMRKKSAASFLDEMKRCSLLGLTNLNVHPGSHSGEEGEDRCIERIAAGVNAAFEKVRDVGVLLETTAGQGASVGYAFEHLAAMIDKIDDKKRIGVCFDTCHAFAAGYDISTPAGYAAVMKKFDDVIGLSYLKALHLNDSKKALASRVDRHESLGKGELGLGAFRAIMNDPRLDEIPMILETVDDTLWAKEIRMLYTMAGKKNGAME